MAELNIFMQLAVFYAVWSARLSDNVDSKICIVY